MDAITKHINFWNKGLSKKATARVAVREGYDNIECKNEKYQTKINNTAEMKAAKEANDPDSISNTIFKAYDTNQDGKLSKAEFEAFVKENNPDRAKKRQIRKDFNKADGYFCTPNNKSLDQTEFAYYIQKNLETEA